jgi:hypothetical protein
MDQRLGVHRGHPRRVEASPQPFAQLERTPKCPFQRHLLVQHHPDQQSKWVPAQELVGSVVAGQGE